MSFHLAFILGSNFVLPDGSDSVDMLRTPFASVAEEAKSSKENLTETKMEFWVKKFNKLSQSENESDKAWQDRLLVVTEKRIFILTEKAIIKSKIKKRQSFTPSLNASPVRTKSISPTIPASVCLEIVDSIPMEEIISVSLDMDSNPGVWDNPTDTERRTSQSDFVATERSLRQLRPKSTDNAREPVLRIMTKPSKFNRGEPYYFLLRQQDCPCLDASESTTPLRTREDADALIARLATLAKCRHTEHAREYRFRRLQKRLRRWWNSVPFNLVVLVLIVSNFAFTVMQLENTDPDMQPFYENVDLAYTVLFTAGAHPAHSACTQ
jgi:hypothetical protein